MDIWYSHTPILRVLIYIWARLGPIPNVAPILKVRLPTLEYIYFHKSSQPLLVHLCNMHASTPYVSVQTSFHSKSNFNLRAINSQNL